MHHVAPNNSTISAPKAEWTTPPKKAFGVDDFDPSVAHLPVQEKHGTTEAAHVAHQPSLHGLWPRQPELNPNRRFASRAKGRAALKRCGTVDDMLAPPIDEKLAVKGIQHQ